jgi:hypothetical protein
MASSIPGIELIISDIKLATPVYSFSVLPRSYMFPNPNFCFIVSGSTFGSTSIANRLSIPFIYVGVLVNFWSKQSERL